MIRVMCISDVNLYEGFTFKESGVIMFRYCICL